MTGQVRYAALLVAALLAGCSAGGDAKKQAVDQVTAPFAEAAITLNVKTDPDLNALNDIANSCTLLIIQAQKAATLNKLLSSPFALKGLFSGAGAQDEILKVDRYAAMPGQQITLHIDRSEDTRYVAVVAGYYPFPQKQHMALVAVPVTTTSSGWLSPSWLAKLTPLTLQLRLSRDGISQFDGATREPLSLTQQDAAPAPTGNKDK